MFFSIYVTLHSKAALQSLVTTYNWKAMNQHADAFTSNDALSGKPRVLFLDDDEANLVAFSANFRSQFEIYTTVSAFDAYNLIEDKRIQVVLADHRMPSISGVDFLETVARDYPEV